MAAGSIVIDLLLKSGAFSTDTKRAERSLKGMGAEAKKTGLALVAMGTAAATAFVVMAKKTINSMDAMSKQAQMAGVSTESLSRLGHAADLSGLNTEKLTSHLGRLTKGMFDASQGIGEAKKAFDALGIDGGSIDSADEALLQIADRFASMPDGLEKTNLAMQLFGRSGKEMIPFLNQGRDGLKNMGDEAERFGLVMTTEGARAAEEFNDNLSRLSKIGQGVFIQMANEWLPTINKFVGAMFEASKASLNFGESLFVALGLKTFTNLQDANEQVIKQTVLVADLRKEYEKLAADDRTDAFDGFTGAFASRLKIEEQKLKMMEAQADAMQGLGGPAATVFSPAVALPSATSTSATGRPDDTIDKLLQGSRDLYYQFLDNQDVQLKSQKIQEAMVGLTEHEAQIQGQINRVLAETDSVLERIAQNRRDAADAGASPEALAWFDSEMEAVKALGHEYAELSKVQAQSAISAQRTFSFGWNTAFKQFAEDSNNSARQAADMFDSVTGRMSSAISQFVDTGKFSFKDFATSVIKDMISIELQAQASRALSAIIGAIGGAVAGSFGPSPFAQGGAGGGFAEGGFTGAGGKFEPAGVVHRGEYVINADQTKRLGLGFLNRLNQGYANGGYVGTAPSAMGGGVNINIKNEASADGYNATAQTRQNSDGGMNIDIMVRRVVSADMQSNGQLSQQMASTFGLRRAI